MTDGTDTPTEGQGATVAPAESETSKPAAVASTKPDNETEQATETEAKTEGDESANAKADETEADKPRKRNGYDRLRRKNQYLQSEILRLREEASKPAETDDKAPKEEDFGGDWGKFIAATTAYEARKVIREELSAKEKQANQSRVAELQTEVLSEFEERTEAFKAKAPDFDDVIEKFTESGGKFSDTVRDLVLDSEDGPALAYFLAKNPKITKDLNSLTPLQAAKQLGQIEASLSRPQRKATSAPPPVTPPSGGASPPVDLTSLAKSDNVEAYAAMRRKQREARA